MRANVVIADLIKMPNFGANKIIKTAMSNLAASQFLGYSLVKNEKVVRFVTLYPNPLNEDQPLRHFVEVEYDSTDEAIVTLFNKIKQGDYIDRGEVLGDDLKEAVVPIREKYLEAKLGYGTNPTLIRVIRGGQNRATLYFTTTKNGKAINHTANWSVVDIAKEITDVISIPKTLFNTYREFNAILEDLLGVEAGRFVFKVDPADVLEDHVSIYVNSNDLVYSGSLTVMLPESGDKATKIGKFEKTEPTDPEPTATFEAIITSTADSTVAIATAEQEDVLYVRIKGTGLTEPTTVALSVTQADGSNGATLDAATAVVPVDGYVTVPLLIEAVLNEATMSVVVKHETVTVDTATITLKPEAIVKPNYSALASATLIYAGAEIGLQIAPDDSNTRYVPTSVVWSSAPAGVTFETLDPQGLSVMAKFPEGLEPGTVVNISVLIDGQNVAINPITIRDPG